MARFNGGWFKIYREVLGTDIGKHPTRLALFTHLIAMANIDETWVEWRGKPRKCPRGSLVTSYRELSKVIGADTKMIERQLKYLALRDTLVVEPDTRGTYITINNYSDYQDKFADPVQQPTHQHHGDDDADGDTDRDSNEELRNKNKRNKNNNAVFFSEKFEKAWAEYKNLPNVLKGQGAEGRFAKQIKNDFDFDQLLLAITNYRQMLAQPANQYRKPKTTFETFLGTKSTSFFWRTFIDWKLPTVEDVPLNEDYFDKEVPA